MEEADAGAELPGISGQVVEETQKRLHGVHRIQHDPLLPGQLDQHFQLLLPARSATLPLVAVQQVDRPGRLHRQAEALRRPGDRGSDVLPDLGRRMGDRHSHHLGREPGQLPAHEQARLAPAAERRGHERVEGRRAVPPLFHDLVDALEIPEGAELGGPALGNDVRTSPPSPDGLAQPGEDAVDPPELLGRAVDGFGAEELPEQEVPVVAGRLVALESHDGPEPQARRHRRNRPAAVGLERPARDQRVGPLA